MSTAITVKLVNSNRSSTAKPIDAERGNKMLKNKIRDESRMEEYREHCFWSGVREMEKVKTRRKALVKKRYLRNLEGRRKSL